MDPKGICSWRGRSVVLFGLATLSVALTMATTAKADADPTFGPFTFINNTGVAVYDLETVWAFTGGTLANCVVTTNSGPGAANCNATSNMVNITWNDGGLMNGGTIAFKMDSDFGADFAGGNWTDINGNIIGTATPTPEPATMVLFGTALIGLAARRKR